MTKKEKQLKDNIIRVNDVIKIINPNIFIRCGYPLELKKVTKMIGTEYHETIRKFVQDIIQYDNKFKDFELKFNHPEKEFEDISRCLAYRYIRKHKFGGDKKEIYTLYVPELEDSFGLVEKIRIIHTGQYQPDHSSQSQDGEYDYEPACLVESQRHKILTVWNKDGSRLFHLYPKDIIHNTFQIEAKRVEKVKDLENNPYRNFVQ